MKTKVNDSRNSDSELVIDDRPPHKVVTIGELRKRDVPKPFPDPSQFATMPPGQVDHHLKSVAGRILTLIDGAFPEGKQNAALKSLIKKEFREEFSRVFNYFYSDVRSAQGCDEANIFDRESQPYV